MKRNLNILRKKFENILATCKRLYKIRRVILFLQITSILFLSFFVIIFDLELFQRTFAATRPTKFRNYPVNEHGTIIYINYFIFIVKDYFLTLFLTTYLMSFILRIIYDSKKGKTVKESIIDSATNPLKYILKK